MYYFYGHSIAPVSFRTATVSSIDYFIHTTLGIVYEFRIYAKNITSNKYERRET